MVSATPSGFDLPEWDRTVCWSPRCKRTIAFVLLGPGGRKHPVDVVPSDEGTLGLTSAGQLHGGAETEYPTAVLLSEARRETWQGPRYMTHFATCPAAAQFRRRR